MIRMFTCLSVALCAFTLNTPEAEARKIAPHVRALNWGQFALVKTNEKNAVAEDRTRVTTEWTNLESVPPSFTLFHPLGFKRLLRETELALIPVHQIKGRWHVYDEAVRHIALNNPANPSRTLDVLNHWQTINGLPERAQINALLKQVDDRLPFARAGARERLLALFSKPIRPSLTMIQVAESASVITARSRPLRELKHHLMFLGRIGGALTANWIASRFFIDFPETLRAHGIRIMGRHPTMETRRTLSRCLTSGRPVMARICSRWLSRH
jgi:hypothetical protein